MTLQAIQRWADEVARLTTPDRLVFCDGSEEERARLTRECLDSGELIELDQAKLPGCYLHRSAPHDVARTEHLTFVCTERKEDAGPNNNWIAPAEARSKLEALYRGAMKGRTLYVAPFLMGPPGSPFSRVGVEITDSRYVVLNMRIMTRMGRVALDHLGEADDFTRCLHSLGDLDPARRFICHFPQDNAVWSVGSGYGGNALLGKKCLALRLASCLGRDQGWLAEHMLILGLQDPRGTQRYIAAAFPSACGKTNLAMLVPPASLPGWKVTTLGDDIAWMRPGKDGTLRALNPEAGLFGVVPGTSHKTNPNAMEMIRRDTIYTNVALRPDGTPWWEGHDDPPPASALDWQGRPWTPASKEKAAHPNSRFTVSATQCPSISPEFENPEGVPITAILFGGRRGSVVPLVFQSRSWQHGVFLGATLTSETTAAITGAQGVVRRDPMAMLAFCGYHMGDYFAHWLAIGKKLAAPPKIFRTNWFRKGKDGRFLWPGYGENLRALKWILERCEGRGAAVDTVIGAVPTPAALAGPGLDVSPAALAELLEVDPPAWLDAAEPKDGFFESLGERLPAAIREERDQLSERCRQAAGR